MNKRRIMILYVLLGLSLILTGCKSKKEVTSINENQTDEVAEYDEKELNQEYTQEKPQEEENQSIPEVNKYTEDIKSNENIPTVESTEKEDKPVVTHESKNESNSDGQVTTMSELDKIINENSEYQSLETMKFDLKNMSTVFFENAGSAKSKSTKTGDLWCYGDGFHRLIKRNISIRADSMVTVTIDGELWLRYDEDHPYYATSTLLTLNDKKEWAFLHLPGILENIEQRCLSVTQYINVTNSMSCH